MDFSEKIKLIREHTGLKQVEFGECLGVNQRTISHWESGRNEPSIDVLKRITTLWSINPDWLLTGKGAMHLSDSPVQSSHNTVGDNSIVVNGNGNINIAIKKEDFKDDSEDIKHLVSLLKYAPKSFIKQIIDRLQKFKELSQL